jgi:hypothetical protein
VLGSLTRLRNQAEHAELYGHSDEMLTTVQRQLALIPELAMTFAPDLLETAIEKWDNQAESRLKAIRDQVDAAWQVVLDYLRSAGTVECPCEGMVVTVAPETDLTVHIIGSGGFASNRIYSLLRLPWHDAGGMFRRILLPEPPLEMDGLFSDLIAGSAGRSFTPPTTRPGLLAILGRAMGSPPPEKPGRVPAEDGSLNFSHVPGDLSLHMPSKRRSYVSARVELRKWSIMFRSNVLEGSVDGQLISAKESEQADPARTVHVSGSVVLTTEGVASKDSEELGFATGATLRWFKGTLAIQLANR